MNLPIRPEVKERIVEVSESEVFQQHPCFYIYDLIHITEQIKRISKAFGENVSTYYAMKANPSDEIVKLMSNSNGIAGVEIASSGELFKALKHFRPDQIIFTGPGKTNCELKLAIESRIRWVNVESITEAHKLSTLADSNARDILVRVNLAQEIRSAHARISGISSRIGIDEEIIVDQIRSIAELPNINLQGLHTFSASGILEADDLVDCFANVFELSSKVEGLGIPIDVIDLGGGFGIDYSGRGKQLDLLRVANGLAELTDNYHYQDKELVFEIGRYLVGESGFYVTEILDIKESRGQKHVVAAGGINHQMRPVVAEMDHPVSVIPRKKPRYYPGQTFVDHEHVQIGGPLCLRGDVLGQHVFVEKAEIGDLLVLHQSGAYGLTMAALEFHSHPHPLEYFVE